ncbi:MAG: HD domain-containing phosphohydrolase [Desulfonauticus sp.]|nr:HD domain-containing phosphohydrolase [Desulfonauticus sp.]
MSAKINLSSLNEEFYQISPKILESFSKFRMPLDLYIFKEKIGSLEPFYKRDTRLQEEQRKEILELADQGLLFVSRNDHAIYTKHISKQLDLILIDKHLTPQEITSILKMALPEKILEFYEQPVAPAWQELKESVLILLQYIKVDTTRLKGLLKNIFFQEKDLDKVTYSTAIIGLNLIFEAKLEIKEKELANLAMGLFSYDLGLYRIPKFIREKTGNLTPEEQQKITNHPLHGVQIMRKLDIREEFLLNCHLEHHEFFDGSGYPRKLSGKNISLAGQISSLAHYSSQLFTKGLSPQQVLSTLSKEQTKFAPKIYNAMLNIITNTWIK